MFAYAVAVSYSVLHAIARAVGLPPWAARLWPLGFEASLAAAALNALAEQRHRRHLAVWHHRVPWYPWTLTGLSRRLAAELAASWERPAPNSAPACMRTRSTDSRSRRPRALRR
jgi:Protein of unknown function (DUF2637)